MAERIIPTHVIVDGRVYATGELLEEFKRNGRDEQKVKEASHILAERRRVARDPKGNNDLQNWYDAEKKVAISELIKNGPRVDEKA